ncbi:hypothetical protein MASR2M29_14600 [Spirochaetota bacterium]
MSNRVKIFLLAVLYAGSLNAQEITVIPPLRIALTPGDSSLDSASVWQQLSEEMKRLHDTALDIRMVRNQKDCLALLYDKLVEIAIIDPIVFVQKQTPLKVLGSLSYYGQQYERFVLIVAKNSIIHKKEDLWRAKFVASGGPGSLSWDYPIAVFLGDLIKNPDLISLEYDYEGVLLNIAMNKSDAGFVPEGFLKKHEQNVLGLKLRELLYTDSYPLYLLVTLEGIEPVRLSLAEELFKFKTSGISLYKEDSILLEKIEHLKVLTGEPKQ